MTKIYIAGPMTGIENFNFEAFDEAEKQWDSHPEWVSTSPAWLDRIAGFKPEDLPRDTDWSDPSSVPGFDLRTAIKRDLKALQTCDAIYLLDGWEDSKGAKAEKSVAEWLGLEIMYQTDPEAKEEPDQEGWIRNKGKMPCDPETMVDVKFFDGVVEKGHRARYWYWCLDATDDTEIEFWKPVEPCDTATKEGETIETPEGGKHSFTLANFDCIPPECLRLLAQCLGFGAAKYGKENWKKIPIEDNLAHAMNHINEWRRGDRTEPHLVNAMARITFSLWLAVDSGEQEDTYRHPEMV